MTDYALVIITIIWLKLYLGSWKALEKTLAINWGTFGQSQNLEKDREDFICSSSVQIFSSRIPNEEPISKFISYTSSFIITSVMIVLTITSLIMFQNIQMPSKDQADVLISLESKNNFLYQILPFLIGIYIKLFSRFFDFTCTMLTNAENHQKESSYKMSYLLKCLIFNMVNYYFTFYYIIFNKSQKNDCPDNDCLKYLTNQINKIFFSYFTAAVIEMAFPLLNSLLIRLGVSRSIKENQKEATAESVERIKVSIFKKYSYILFPVYEVNESDREYVDIIILFGYVAQFGIIEPFLFIIFALYIFAQRIIDATKICFCYNVDVFNIATGIGVYNKIMKFILLLSSFINLYILYFVKNVDKKLMNKVDHWFHFIIVQNFFIILIFFMDFNFLPKWVEHYANIREDFIKMKSVYVKEKTMLKTLKLDESKLDTKI